MEIYGNLNHINYELIEKYLIQSFPYKKCTPWKVTRERSLKIIQKARKKEEKKAATKIHINFFNNSCERFWRSIRRAQKTRKNFLHLIGIFLPYTAAQCDEREKEEKKSTKEVGMWMEG